MVLVCVEQNPVLQRKLRGPDVLVIEGVLSPVCIQDLLSLWTATSKSIQLKSLVAFLGSLG